MLFVIHVQNIKEKILKEIMSLLGVAIIVFIKWFLIKWQVKVKSFKVNNKWLFINKNYSYER